MPIHDQGYRRYAGLRKAPGRAWSVIARTGIRTMVARKPFIALLLLAWLPFLVRSVQIYAAANLPQADFLAPDARLFRQFLDQQAPFLFFVTVYAGSGLIANDRRANALPLYLARPLTRLEYVFGKGAVLAALLLFVTWVPAMLLLVVQVAFAGSLAFLRSHLFLFPAITLFSLVQVTVVTLLMLALSSLSRSSRYVGILYAAVLFFTRAVSGIVYGVTRDSRLSWISVSSNIEQVGDALFRLPSRAELPVAVPALVLALLVTVSILVLQRRIQGVEVVS